MSVAEGKITVNISVMLPTLHRTETHDTCLRYCNDGFRNIFLRFLYLVSLDVINRPSFFK
jgi:hypothetical protein